MNWAFVVDNRSCIGCHACSTACKSENEVPLGVYRTWVKTVETGSFPNSRRSFQVTRCNHCANPPCVRICPTGAMHARPDGIVQFASDACIGCKACLQACPYDAIHIDPEHHTAAKCHFCAHRIDVGLEPACVVVCPTHSILAGDLDNPESEVSRVLARNDAVVRKPEQGTAPKLFYIGGSDVVMHPTAAVMPSTLLTVDRAPSGRRSGPVVDGTQGLPSTGPIGGVTSRMASHLVTYDVQHHVPWHWPIPAYLITKAVAGGIFALLACMALGFGPPASGRAIMIGGAPALVAWAVTIGLLIYDLDRPDRFFFLFLRPQWRSWVARAAWLLSGFGALAGFWWAAEMMGNTALRTAFAVVVLPLAVLSAVYSAFLFAQAEGRDFWQSGHLAPALLLQAGALGGLALAAVGDLAGLPGIAGYGAAVARVALFFGALVVGVGDALWPHATETAQRGAANMVRGPWAPWWWTGLALGWVAPILVLGLGAPGVAFVAAVVGQFAWAMALVMAPQEIPNA